MANNLEKSSLSELNCIVPNKLAISSPVLTYSGIKLPSLVSTNFFNVLLIIGLVSINIFLLISSKLFMPYKDIYIVLYRFPFIVNDSNLLLSLLFQKYVLPLPHSPFNIIA
ncbi:hypothetical protein D3C80_1882610 [compost metagenome]